MTPPESSAAEMPDDLHAVVEQTPDGNWHATLYDGNRRVRDIQHGMGPGIAFSFRWSARRAARRAIRWERRERRGQLREEVR